MQTEFFRLEILTPVHIGTGDEADPMSYLMRREGDGPACHILDTHSWASDYPDPDELCAKFSGGNIPQMRKFLADNIDPDIYGIRRIRVSDETIFREYEQKRDDQRTSNQLRISPHLSSNGHDPILPGSSLKGALRTAVIDWLDREQKLELKCAPEQYIKKLEGVLGKIGDNVFKHLKISDVTGWADSTLLVEAREIRRKEGKNATPKNKCEVFPSRFQNGEKSAVLFGKYSLGRLLSADSRLTLPNGKSWSWEELALLVNHYFLSRLEKEKAKFFQQPHFAQTLPVAEQLSRMISSATSGQMFLRVGHYSHVEFVTVTDNQPATRKGKDGKPLPYGTTRTLANGALPFGWISITPCKEDEYQEGINQREEHNHLSKSRREERRLTIARNRTAELAKKEAAKKEAEQKQAEAAARQAEEQQRRAAMSPIEQQIYQLKKNELQEHQVVQLFNELPGLEEVDRMKIAQALKEFWQVHGKWGKKECSKKQWEKVQQVKKYLGEA